ncbi:hypothetical protein ACFQ4C_07785 [Larkinella insperata]|uniref:Uncharacterized protein n=1 Tax=Larkinella insperata TaxID=332158 RepID=A0ABW3Q5M0_9BACT|nr:hypothetical protein [Larkinella insperata]
MNFSLKTFFKSLITTVVLFAGIHALIQLGYPLLKGRPFDEAWADYRFPFLAIPLAVGVALLRQQKE